MRGLSEQERRERNWELYFNKGFFWALRDWSPAGKDAGLYEISYWFNSDSTDVRLSFYGTVFIYAWNELQNCWDYVMESHPTIT